jgi:hypothetical protein
MDYYTQTGPKRFERHGSQTEPSLFFTSSCGATSRYDAPYVIRKLPGTPEPSGGYQKLIIWRERRRR